MLEREGLYTAWVGTSIEKNTLFVIVLVKTEFHVHSWERDGLNHDH